MAWFRPKGDCHGLGRFFSSRIFVGAIYLAAWDVHRAKVFGRYEPKTTIVSFYRFVGEVMRQKPYRTAKRVFRIVDNASIHRGQASVERFRQQWPNSELIHTPTHASWLNQVEITANN